MAEPPIENDVDSPRPNVPPVLDYRPAPLRKTRPPSTLAARLAAGAMAVATVFFLVHIWSVMLQEPEDLMRFVPILSLTVVTFFLFVVIAAGRLRWPGTPWD